MYPCKKESDDGSNHELNYPLRMIIGLHDMIYVHCVVVCLFVCFWGEEVGDNGSDHEPYIFLKSSFHFIYFLVCYLTFQRTVANRYVNADTSTQ